MAPEVARLFRTPHLAFGVESDSLGGLDADVEQAHAPDRQQPAGDGQH
jgi:hypothetical protein